MLGELEEGGGLAAIMARDEALMLGWKMGKPPGNDKGNDWAAAAAAWTVADRERREVERAGPQGATLPVEGALREESVREEKVAVRRAEEEELRWCGPSGSLEGAVLLSMEGRAAWRKAPVRGGKAAAQCGWRAWGGWWDREELIDRKSVV